MEICVSEWIRNYSNDIDLSSFNLVWIVPLTLFLTYKSPQVSHCINGFDDDALSSHCAERFPSLYINLVMMELRLLNITDSIC